jgi:hypothetical protein
MPQGAKPFVACSHAYVWQRRWNQALANSLAEANGLFQGLRVLVMEMDPDGRIHHINLSPTMLRQFRGELRPVIRVNGAHPPSWQQLHDGVQQALVHWQRAGLSMNAIELDHDCASARLPEYQATLAQLRLHWPELQWSITALPSWLNSPIHRALFDTVDEVVLQVHALDRGTAQLFDLKQAQRWFETMRARHPRLRFWLALPAYGIAVGELAGQPRVLAEGVRQAPSDWRELQVEPHALARWLRQLEAQVETPVGFQGWIWFRLPTAEDARAFSMRTLAAIERGERLQGTLSSAVIDQGAQRYLLRLHSSGTLAVELPERLQVSGQCSAAGALADVELVRHQQGYLLTRNQQMIIKAGEVVDLAWLRCQQRPEIRFR